MKLVYKYLLVTLLMSAKAYALQESAVVNGFSESEVEDGATKALFSEVTIDSKITDFSEYKFSITGLLAEDSVQFGPSFDVSDAGEISLDGTVIAQLDLTAMGQNGQNLLLGFTDNASSSNVNLLLTELLYQNSLSNPTSERLWQITLINDNQTTFLSSVGYVQQSEDNAPITLDDAVTYSAPVFVDLDGDSDSDVVVGQRDGGLAYFENIGSDTSPLYEQKTGDDNPFENVSVDLGAYPAFADLDNDQDLDLVLGEYFGRLYYFQNQGTATSPLFTRLTGADNPFTSIDIGSYSTPSLADLDGDGDVDLVIGEYGGILNFYQNQGTAESPSFVALQGSSNPFDGIDIGYSSTPRLLDYDGDGDTDLLIGERDSKVNYYRNEGDDNNAEFVALTGESDPFDGLSLSYDTAPTFADIDSDGDIDLLVGDRLGDLTYFSHVPEALIAIVEQNDPPIIGLLDSYQISENTFDIVALYAQDEEDDELQWQISDLGDAEFFTLVDGRLQFHDAPNYESAEDLDADGVYQIELAVTDGVNDAVTANIDITVLDVEESPELGTFTINQFSESEVENGGTKALFSALDIADPEDSFVGVEFSISGLLDEDNIAIGEGFVVTEDGEIVFEDAELGEIIIGYVLSRGVAGEDFVIQFTSSATNAYVTQFLSELMYQNSVSNPNTQRFLSIELGFAGERWQIAAQGFVEKLAESSPFNEISLGDFATPSFVDLDNDGDLDLVVADATGEILYYENQTESGSELSQFTQRFDSGNPFNQISLSQRLLPTFADIDGDQDFDLILGDKSGLLHYYRNQGDATTAQYVLQSEGNNPFSGISTGGDAAPEFADLDGDLDLDLVIGEQGGGVVYYQNVGGTSLPNYQMVEAVADPFDGIDGNDYSVPLLNDFDADGDVDLLLGGWQGELMYFENTGSERVAEYMQMQVSEFSDIDVGSYSSPVAVDINNDGISDLVIGTGDGRLSYYQNVPFADLSITAVNDAPEIENDNQQSIPENSTAVMVLYVTEEEGQAYRLEISGGADAGLFRLNGHVLEFIAAPNFEAPSDIDVDNLYEVTIKATDVDENDSEKSFAISVVNSVEGISLSSVSPVSLTEQDESQQLQLFPDATVEFLESTNTDISLTIAFDALDDVQIMSQGSVSVDEDAQTIAIDGQNVASFIYQTSGSNNELLITLVDEISTVQLQQLLQALQLHTTVADGARGEITLDIELQINGLSQSFGQGIEFEPDYTTFASITDAQSYSTIAIADMNADGLMDAVVADDAGNIDLYIFQVTEAHEGVDGVVSVDGRYELAPENPFAEFSANLFPRLAAGDINNDGMVDLVIGDAGGELTLLLQQASSSGLSFAVDSTLSFSAITSDAAPTLFDIDDDGDLDIVIGSTGNKLYVVENLAEEKSEEQSANEGNAQAVSFATDLQLIALTEAFNSAVPAITDLYELGQQHLVVSDQSGALLAAEFSGLGYIYQPQNVAVLSELTELSSDYLSVHFADFDQDGDDDLFLADAVNGIKVYEKHSGYRVAIEAVNDAPVITSSSAVTIEENENEVIELTASDEEGDPLTWHIAGGPDSELFELEDYVLRFIDAPDFESALDEGQEGTYELTVEVSDGNGGLDSISLIVTVENVEEPVVYGEFAINTFAEQEVESDDGKSLFSSAQVYDPEDNFAGVEFSITGLLTQDSIVLSSPFTVNESGEVVLDDVVIGQFKSGMTGQLGADLVMVFNDNANNDTVNAFLQNLSYQNVDQMPTTERWLTISMGSSSEAKTLAAAGYQPIEADSNPLAMIVTDALARLATGDIDGDDDLDLLLAEADGSFELYINNEGVYELAESGSNPFVNVAGLADHTPILADIDADSDLDLISASSVAIEYYRNEGDVLAADFVRQELSNNPFGELLGSFAANISLVDIDGDIDLDVVIANEQGDVQWFENIGGVALPIFSNSPQATGIAIPTLTGFSFTRGESGELSVLLGDASGKLHFYMAEKNDGMFSAIDNPFAHISHTESVAPYFVNYDKENGSDNVNVNDNDSTESKRDELWLSAASGELKSYRYIEQAKLSVTPENDAPVVTLAANAIVVEQNLFALTLEAMDADSTELQWSIVGGDDSTAFEVRESDLYFVSAPSFDAPSDVNQDNVYQVVLVVSDGEMTSDEFTLAVNVQQAELAMVDIDSSYEVNENTATITALPQQSGTGESLVWTISGADSAHLEVVDYQFRFVSAPDYEGPTDSNSDNTYQLTLNVKGSVDTQSFDVDIKVLDVDEQATSGGNNSNGGTNSGANSGTNNSSSSGGSSGGGSLSWYLVLFILVQRFAFRCFYRD